MHPVSPLIAVVLAGGAARRFGSDKLAAKLGGLSVLEHLLAGLPAAAEVIVVGPPRPFTTTGHDQVRFVREEPPGGGPAAALVAGLRVGLALAEPAGRFVVLPGDAPYAGAAVELLLAAIGPQRPVAVAVDTAGLEQPLQLGLTVSGARALIAAAGPGGGANQSARVLLRALHPPPTRVAIGPEQLRDVDTPADLAALQDTVDEHLRNVGDA